MPDVDPRLDTLEIKAPLLVDQDVILGNTRRTVAESFT
jgi:hypothetical protein